MKNIKTPKVVSASFSKGKIKVKLDNKQQIEFPISINPRLMKGTPEQLSNIRISPFGIHWDDLDEDLSVEGLINGQYGQVEHPHPGVVLFMDYIIRRKLSQLEIAHAVGLPPSRINDLVKGRRNLNADWAIRLSKALGTEPSFWMKLQAEWLIDKKLKHNQEKYSRMQSLVK